jgi:hypothetical protein
LVGLVLLPFGVPARAHAERAPAVIGVRFAGLEALRFRRVDDPATEATPRADQIRWFLPESLPPTGPEPQVHREEDQDAGDFFSVQEFSLPQQGALKGVVLRQLLWHWGRMTDQWWCLYEAGKRTDCWFSSPAPTRVDDERLLAPLEIEEVRATGAAEWLLRTCGSMFRPQGAWWWSGKDLVFQVVGRELRLQRVVSRFDFFRGYDLGDIPPVQVQTTRSVASPSGLEVRRLESIDAADAKACGFRDPTDPDAAAPAEIGCEELERVARCLTARPRAR